MGNVCAVKKKKGSSSRKLILAMLGLDNAGKTVTTKGLQGESLDTVAPTIGFSSAEFNFDGHEITLFDLGGGKRIRDIWKNYFAEVYGVIYVIDASEPDRMDECQSVLRNLLSHPQVSGKPVLILANKQDKRGALDEIDVCEHLNLEELVNINKSPCRVETCAAIVGVGKKLDKSIKSGMSWLLETISNMHTRLYDRVDKDTKELREREARDKEERRERVRKIKEEREKKEAEERALRGEDEKVVSEDEPDHGNPFKRLDPAELLKTEQRLKAQKKKLKEQELHNRRSLSDPEDNDGTQRPRLSLRSRLKDPDEDTEVPQQSVIRSTRSPGDNFALPSRTEALRTSGRYGQMSSPRLGQRKLRQTQDSDDDDEDDTRNTDTRPPWGKDRTPRPYDLKPAPSLTPRLGHRTLGVLEEPTPSLSPRLGQRGLGVGEEEAENRQLYHRRPLVPLAPLEPLDGGDTFKKKKKKKAKKNQTSPLALENDDSLGDYQPKVSPFAPRGWGTPPGQRSMLKASLTPRLETLQEPDNERSDTESSNFASKWGLVDDLPELPTGMRSLRPNSEYDDDIMT